MRKKWLRKKWLIIKVFFTQVLIRLKLIPNVWYACEIELGTIRSEELYKFFKWDEYDAARKQSKR